MKKKENKNKRVFFCPYCNSRNIITDFSNPAAVRGGLLKKVKHCENCGYKGNFFPQAKIKDIPKVKSGSKIRKRPLVNNVVFNPYKLSKGDEILINIVKWGFLLFLTAVILYYSYKLLIG